MHSGRRRTPLLEPADPMAQTAQLSKRSGDPHVAMLLTWFVPGAGHLYLGRVRLAVGAFLVIEGLYLLGFLLSEGLFLNVLPAELRGPFAGVLAPEVGNLGALLLQLSKVGFLDQPRAWPEYMDLGMNLTAASGVLNLALVSRANLDARIGERRVRVLDPGLAAALSWMAPGAAHWLQGRRRRGVALFTMLVGLFLLGSMLAEGANLDRERHFYYWAGQFLLGLPAVVTEFLYGHPRVSGDIPYVDAGIVLGCVAGMLNVLVMLDAYGWSEARLLGDEPGERAQDEASGAARPGSAETESEATA